ncbi:hypothetical protein HOY80DRAFT_1115458 [Tuber brumale]|nr:hypothetical protein HOY80DRAFT_1115466 [Tuber brumale]KAG0632700.1 hypothetical protein HOY80DRAFT_1115458 [Tuber brumale]
MSATIFHKVVNAIKMRTPDVLIYDHVGPGDFDHVYEKYKDFGAPFARAVKEADFTFIPLVGPGRTKSAEFPFVVLESGWSESAARLREDARLWQGGSAGTVRVVLQVKFYQRNWNN